MDVAIDSDSRVIEDTDGGRFVVLDGRTQYVFESSSGSGTEHVVPPETAPSNGEPASDESVDLPDGAGDDGEQR